MHDLSRRNVLRRALLALAGVATLPRMAHPAAPSQACVDPESESLRDSLHYASLSAVVNQACSGCAFFTQDAGRPACGNCVIMSGPVDEKGHCDSWSARG